MVDINLFISLLAAPEASMAKTDSLNSFHSFIYFWNDKFIENFF